MQSSFSIRASFGLQADQPEGTLSRLAALAADLLDAPQAMVVLGATSGPPEAHDTALLQTLGPILPTPAGEVRTLAMPEGAWAVAMGFTAPDGAGALCVLGVREAPSDRNLSRLTTLAEMVQEDLALGCARQAADEKTRLLQMAERLSGVGHWRYDVAADRMVWSDEFYRIQGLDRDSCDPDVNSTIGFCHEADRVRVRSLVDRAIRLGEGFECALTIQRTDGVARHVTCKAECQLDARGRTIGLVGVFQDVTEHQAALDNLRRGQDRFKLLADNSADVIARIRLDGSSTYISPAIERLLGHRPEAMIGRSGLDFVYEPDRPQVVGALVRLAEGEDEVTLQHRAAHESGSPVWVETRFQLIRGESGKTPEAVAVIRDITERKRMETAMLAARQAAEELARRAEVAESVAGLGHWRIDAATLALTCSPQLRRIYGLDGTGTSTPDLEQMRAMVHPEDRPGGEIRLARQIQGEETEGNWITRILRPSGEIRYLQVASRVERAADGAVLAVVGTTTDVTDQRLAEMALAESEAKFRSLAQNAPDMITECDLEGVLTYVSPASLAITGFEPQELVGLNAFSLMSPEDGQRLYGMCAALVASDGEVEATPFVFQAAHRAGRAVWLECKPGLKRDTRTGEIIGLTDVIRDVTARKALESDLRHARADAEAAAAVKSEFLANMSHELRTPLTSILGFTRLAADQPDLSPRTRDYIARVKDASSALLCTVNDILDFSKLEAGQVSFEPEPVVLQHLGRSCLDLFTPQAEAKALDLRFDLPPDHSDLVVLIDPDRLRQILLNLLGNAVKFTDRGSVALSVRYDWDTARLAVEVIDTGHGIPPEKLDLLFKRFSQVDGSLTRAHGGTGLGLAICKGLVEGMGGVIGAESSPGLGSRFWFEIPAHSTQVSAGVEADRPEPQGLGPFRVLVVDDHPANRELARLFLGGAGAEVAEAHDGLQAVELASREPFDVILMDMRMPNLDGPGALTRIRSAPGPNRSTPVLAFTADADLRAGDGFLAMGFQGVITKPLTPEGLVAAVAEAVQTSDTERALAG